MHRLCKCRVGKEIKTVDIIVYFYENGQKVIEKIYMALYNSTILFYYNHLEEEIS